MNENEIKEFLSNVTFDKIKDLRGNGDFIDLANLPEEYEGYLYLTIIDSDKEMNKYLGWSGEDFDGTYVGSVVKHRKQFLKDLRNFDSRVICLNYGEASTITKGEKTMLDFLDARNNPEYFNATNGGSSKMKGLKSEEALDIIIAKLENNEYDIVIESVDTLLKIELFQVRDILEVKGLAKDIYYQLMKTKGKWLDTVMLDGKLRHIGVLVFQDYFGKGVHLRVGSYHTLLAADDCEYVDELRAIYIPKEDWKDLDETEKKDLGFWDNRKTDEVKSDVTPEQAVSLCVEFCENNNVKHTDKRVKNKLKRWKFSDHEIKSLIPKMRQKLAKNIVVPFGHTRIPYKENPELLKAKCEEYSNEYTHCIALNTIHYQNHWGDYNDFIINLLNDKNLKKPNWTILWWSSNDPAHKNWPKRQYGIEEQMKKLVKRFDFTKISKKEKYEINFHFENLAYTKPNKMKKSD